jgi:hypothetical protein
MNRHAVFVDVARFQINFVAAYPATIGVFELGRLHFAPSLEMLALSPVSGSCQKRASSVEVIRKQVQPVSLHTR